MAEGPGNVIITIGAHVADAVSGLRDVDKALGDTMTRGQKATAGLKKAAVPAAAALGALGFAAIDATKAAIEDAAAQDKLSGQLKRTAKATDDQVKSAEDYITKLTMQTGVADDDLRPALGKLATATHDVTKAQDALALAVDISAATGKDLDTVTTALAKGYAGNTAALSRLVPGIDQAALSSKDMAKITASLADLTGGAATQAAKTAEGQYRSFKVQMGELQEAIGAGLIPVIQALLPLMLKGAQFAQEHTTAIKALVGIVAALAAGILAANAAIKAYEAIQVAVKAATAAWTAAQWLLNTALDANPIGAVVIAITALGAALVVAYNKSETFRNIVDGALNAVKGAVNALNNAFDALKGAAIAAFNWIQDNWKLALFAFGPIGAAVYVISENFDKVKNAAQAAWNLISGFGAGGLVTIKNVVWQIVGAFNHVVSAIESAIGAVRSLIDAVGDLLGWIGRIHFPHIPHIPGVNMAAMAAPAVAGRSTRLAAPSGVTINVYGAVDPEGTARTIRRLLSASDRRTGRAK